MSISFDKVFGLHAKALMLHSKRAEILSNNIANADTPGFKARDIDFQDILQQARNSQSQQSGTTLATDHSKHIAGFNSIQNPQLMFRQSSEISLNGNTVDKQVEIAEFTKNALQYQASLKFLNGSIKGILSAIKGE